MKPAASFGTLLLMTGVMGLVGEKALVDSNTMLVEFAERPFEQVQGAAEIAQNLEIIRRTIRQSVTTADASQLASLTPAFCRNVRIANHYICILR